MAEFDYEATDIDGQPASGRLTADDADDAARQLAALGWTVIAVRPAAPIIEVPTNEPAARLSRGESLEVAGHLADLSAAGMPLASGLDALARETANRRIRGHLQALAARLRDGANLSDALDAPGVPADLRAMVRIGMRTGRLGSVLSQYVHHTRRVVGLRRKTLMSLSYAGLITTFAFAFWALYLVWLVPMFRKIFEDFGTELPALTKLILDLSEFLVLYGSAALVVLAVIAGLLVFLAGRLLLPPRRRRFLYAVPVIGSVVRNATVSRFTRLLGILTGGGVPLPEALRLAGEASADPEMAEASGELAGMVASGATLDPLAWPERRLPASLVQLLNMTSRRASLPESLEAAADIYEGRAYSRAALIAPLLEPFIVLAAAFGAIWLVSAMFLPLIKLLNDLS